MYSDIAIVILNWNGKKYLEQFLPSVIQYSENARIIIADNCSTDDSIAFMQSEYPTIEIVRNQSNGGFAKGYNDALQTIESKYYLLLNSDIEVTQGWLTPLYETIQQNNVAACQPKILAFNEQNKFEHAGAAGGYLDRNYFPFCRGRIFDLTEPDENQYNNKQEIFWASGACILIKADIFRKHNGFDEDFFAHMEEIDLCWRIKRTGLSLYVVPSSTVYHVGGGTLAYLSPKKTYLNFRNSLFMIVKNHPNNLFTKVFYRLCLDGIAGLLFTLKGTPNHTIAVLKAHKDFYALLPKMLIKRKKLKIQDGTFNKVGLYKGSILWARYVKGITKYKDLNHRLFSDY